MMIESTETDDVVFLNVFAFLMSCRLLHVMLLLQVGLGQAYVLGPCG